MTENPVDHAALHAVRRRALLVLLGFTVVVTLKLLAVRWFVLGGGDFAGATLDFLFVAAVFAAVDLLFSDMRLRAALITDAVFSALLFAVALYAGYYQALPTREGLATLGQAATVGTGIATILNPVSLLLFADIPLLIWWVVRSRRRGIDPITGRRPGAIAVPGLRTPYVYQRRLVYFAGIAAAIVFALGVNSVRSASGIADGMAVARKHGLVTYLVADVLGSKAQAATVSGTVTAEEVQKRVDELTGAASAARVQGFESGSARGRNVIVIQVEALQAAAIGANVGGTEITPNLNKLIGRSWYFPNHFSGIGRGTTSDAEFVGNTSVYPPPEGAAALMYVDRELTSLPRVLGSHGYDSFTFHTNTASYWNRSQLYPALGFTRFFDAEFFGTEDRIAFGASDRVLFDKALARLKEARANEKPFYAQLITMSSHFPFTQVPKAERRVNMVAPYSGTIEGDYLVEIRYADQELGRFVDALEASGLLDESVVVLYGDHFGIPEPKTEKETRAVEALLGHAYTPVDRLNTPLIIHMPGDDVSRTVTATVGQLDLMPTIADALGADLGDVAHFGRSVFDTGPALLSAGGLLPVGSYVDDSVLYIPGDSFEQGQAWSIETRQPLGIAAASAEKYEATKKLLELSRSYVVNLPIRKDFDANAKVVLPNK